MRTAVVNESTNIVTNVIELEKDAIWEAPEGHFIKFDESVDIGDVWNGESFEHPPAE